jgi:hypothetical protein
VSAETTSTIPAPITESADEKINELYAKLLKKAPKGFATSSMGKFDGFRKWFADTLALGDWKTQTYAVGSAGTSHNFGSRWTQNNSFSGKHTPLGLAFLEVPEGQNTEKLVADADNTSRKFVDGTKPTSFEAILTLARSPDSSDLRARSIQALPGSSVAQQLLGLFPDLSIIDVPWTREQAPAASNPSGPAGPVTAEFTAEAFQPELAKTLQSALLTANYQADAGLVERVVGSLAAKPFLIFAGLSGSGKSLLGIMIAHWLSKTPEQVQVVAVGADWTSKHHLLGYPDALDEVRYVGTPALDLLIRAVANPQLPYFLILDEMNLSHVERYFSDFLSAMESKQAIALHGSSAARGIVESTLEFPGNVFVIGTINVDETTYMFSPKVLDRANVIEFTVSRTSMKNYLLGGGRFDSTAVLGSGAAYGPSLVDFSRDQPLLDELGDENAAAVASSIETLFVLLNNAGMQFGFRTAREMMRYMVACYRMDPDGWLLSRMFDAQLAQRLIPKLSGDSAKLRPVLTALLAFCVAAADAVIVSTEEAEPLAAELSSLQTKDLVVHCQSIGKTFPVTGDKIMRMLLRLQEHGFTTAVEA